MIYLYIDLIKVESKLSNREPNHEDIALISEGDLCVFKIESLDGIMELDTDGEWEEIKKEYK